MFISFLAPFLKTGVIRANFSFWGKTPVENDKLIILHKGYKTDVDTNLNIFTGIWSIEDFVFLSFLIYAYIIFGKILNLRLEKLKKPDFFGQKNTKINFFHISIEISRKMINIKVVERKICNKITPVKISNFLIVFEL